MSIPKENAITSENLCQEENVKSSKIASNCSQLCIIREEIEKLIKGIDEPIDENKVCENYGCRHNIFWEKLSWKRIPSPLTWYIRNCMCLLNDEVKFDNHAEGACGGVLTDRVCSISVIGNIWGITKQRVQRIEKKTMQKMRAILLKGEMDETDLA